MQSGSVKNNASVGIGISGMDRQTYGQSLDEKTYTFQRNGNLETDDNSIGLTNEESNFLCQKMPNGYVVLGLKYDSVNDRVYFFLTQNEVPKGKSYRSSKIIYIDYKNTDIFDGDYLLDYNTLVDDSCNGCLNFNPNYPIFDIVLKQEECGSTITFTDGYNPPRYIALDRLSDYSLKGSVDCGVNNTTSVCLDCDKLNIFPSYSVPMIQAEAIQSGGSLKRGNYEFAICFCDKIGNEMTPYFSFTSPVTIFDTHNNTLPYSSYDDETNYSIKLNVSGLDKRFNHYKVVVIQRTDLKGATESYICGVYGVSEKTVMYTSSVNKKFIPTSLIYQQKPNYKTWGGLVNSNGYLMGYDYTVEKEWNLQPVMNLLGSLVKYQTIEADESLYADGVADSLYRGFMRDEVYPIGIKFHTDYGYSTPVFPLISRPSVENEKDLVNKNSADYKSIQKNTAVKDSGSRDANWQLYNTAFKQGDCYDKNIKEGVTVIRDLLEECTTLKAKSIGKGSITLDYADTFSSLAGWISLNKSSICNTSSPKYNEVLCTLLNTSGTKDNCDSYTDGSLFPFPICEAGDCDNGTCSIPLLLDSYMSVSKVLNEKYSYVKKNVSEYNPTQTTKGCNNYTFGTDNGRSAIKIEIGNKTVDTGIYTRESTMIYNKVCSEPSEFPAVNQSFDTSLTDSGASESPLLASGNIPSTPFTIQDSGKEPLKFNSSLSSNVRWYKAPVKEDSDTIVVEITKPLVSNCVRDAATSDYLRMSIYKDCKYQLISARYWNVNDGLILEFNKKDFPDGVLFALDTPTQKLKFTAPKDEYGNAHNSYRHCLAVPCGCVDVLVRDIEYKSVVVSFDGIEMDKTYRYKSTCMYLAPTYNSKKPIPGEYGAFSYWESSLKYPDNPQLYDSRGVKISRKDLSKLDGKLSNEFKRYYVDGFEEDDCILKNTTNFSCQPIRHFKFPNNNVSPFMSTEVSSSFSNSRIKPIGIKLDVSTVNAFLDICVNNGLITKKQRDSVTKFELCRGDRSIHKSIVMKGIANDMYEDKRNSSTSSVSLFRNFPYNSLGSNCFAYSDSGRNTLINHPYGSSGNNRFSVIAPEVYRSADLSATELSVEGYMYGNSLGGFKQMDRHGKWTILSNRALNLATNLATLEVAFESACAIASAMIEASKNSYKAGGAVFAVNLAQIIGYSSASIIAAANVASAVIFKHSRYKSEWLQNLESLGNSQNFAEVYMSTKGWYNFFKPNTIQDSMVRGLGSVKRLKKGTAVFSEGANQSGKAIRVNNRDREDSLYVSFGDEFKITYPNEYVSYDNSDLSSSNSSRYISSQAGSNNKMDNIRNIASPYFSLKKYIADQYGDIDTVKWLSINHDGYLSNSDSCFPIFGGDIRISRASFKSKTPLFSETAFDMALNTPFDYSLYSSLGYSRFYCSFKTRDNSTGRYGMPFLMSAFNFDCYTPSGNNYEGPPSKFYTQVYGTPQFLVESEINCNYRINGVNKEDKFPSPEVDLERWYQHSEVPIYRDNKFFYNDNLLSSQSGAPYRILPAIYDKGKWDCLADSPNGVVYSQPDNSEISLSDPWLVFRPFDMYHFNTDYGRLVSMSSMETSKVIALFENNASVFEAQDSTVGKTTVDSQALGSGGMFLRKPSQFSSTELGETGTQSKTFVSCEFGHFWVDAKRGKVFNMQSGGGKLNAISDFKASGGESGMRKWFKKHLPFKILKSSNISNLNESHIDNHFKGLGMLMWWDSKYKRIFITKRDYIPLKSNIKHDSGNFFDVSDINNPIKIELSNGNYFKDVSWTVAYSVLYNSWVSYYDFKPDYAVAHNEFFQTGINTLNDKKGLWSHLVSNKSYQMFYGEQFPWEIEVPIKNNYMNSVLQTVKLWTSTKKYINEVDFKTKRNQSFTEAVVYNDEVNSGRLTFEYVDSVKKSGYPKLVDATTQIIPVTHTEGQVKFNYFYNRVLDYNSDEPLWLSDVNDIVKKLNPNTVSFKGKKVLDRLTGDYFRVRLSYMGDNSLKQSFKWQFVNQDLYL